MSNYRKLLVYYVTSSRQYWPLVAVYFLTLESTSVEQIGIYVAVLYGAKFLLEIPSGYIGDTFGHKNTLIIGQVAMGLGALSIALASGFQGFILACLLIALGKSLISGTIDAFYYEMLEEEGESAVFGIRRSEFKGKASLFSMILLIVYPFIASYSITLPFWISAGLSIVGVYMAIGFDRFSNKHSIEESLSITEVIRKQKGTGFYVIALFFAIIGGLYVTEANFREPFIVELGVEVWWVGIMIGGSRFIMYLLPQIPLYKKLDTVTTKSLMMIDMIIMSVAYILAGSVGNGYIVLVVFMGMIGYWQSRKSFISKHLLNTLKNKKYKATLLSIYSQIESVLGFCMALGLGYVMGVYYSLGFISIGVGLVCVLSLYYFLFASRALEKT